MFNLKTKILRCISHLKLTPVKFRPEKDYAIIFKEDGSEEINCTSQIGLVGLKPLTVAFSFLEKERLSSARILITKKSKVLSEISLIRSDLRMTGYAFYHVENSTNYLQTSASKIIAIIGLHVKNRLQPNKNFTMRPKYLKQLFDFCLYPRPVYILSGFEQGEKLSFPIDVVGIYPENKVLFSLRKTSRTNILIQSQKKIILSAAPYSALNAVYSLGKNNFQSANTVPNSYCLEDNLYYPAFGFNIMVISIDIFETIGEHFCYSGKIIKQSRQENTLQLAHAPWFALSLSET